jgi:hypothetical protein
MEEIDKFELEKQDHKLLWGKLSEYCKMFQEGDIIISVIDNKPYKYSGYFKIVNFTGYDCFNNDLVLYYDGEYAKKYYL